MLGIVLTPYGKIPGAPPWEIGTSYGGNGTFLCPPDPQFNTRGEPGLYYDTQLGVTKKGPIKKLFANMRARRVQRALSGLGRGFPTDDEMFSYLNYVPFSEGFVTFKEGTQPGTWIPPNGYNPAGAYGPQFQPAPGVSGLHDDPTVAQLAAQEAHNRKILTLSIISTAAVAVSALVATIRNAKAIKRGR